MVFVDYKTVGNWIRGTKWTPPHKWTWWSTQFNHVSNLKERHAYFYLQITQMTEDPPRVDRDDCPLNNVSILADGTSATVQMLEPRELTKFLEEREERKHLNMVWFSQIWMLRLAETYLPLKNCKLSSFKVGVSCCFAFTGKRGFAYAFASEAPHHLCSLTHACFKFRCVPRWGPPSVIQPATETEI